MAVHSGIDYHTSLAAGWDRRYERGGFRRRADFFRTVILPRLKLTGDWLDLGCGSGYFARMLCRAGARVSGLDGSSEMIKAARSLSGADPGTAAISFAAMEIGDRIALTDASVDGVLSLSVLEYLDRPERCFAEIVRVVKPGGQIVVSVPNRHSAIRRLQHARRALSRKRDSGEAFLSFSRWSVSAAQLRALASGQDLTEIDILPFDPVMPRTMLGVVPASLLYLVARKPAPASPARVTISSSA